MDLRDRIQHYRKIESARKRPLIVYATSTRHGTPAKMASDAVRELIDQMDALPRETRVDVLLHSTGGDPLAAWKLMSVLRERFESVAVLVPFTAFSAATLFSLGADEIVMHPHASLGPIDPQITISSANGSRDFSFEDVGAFLRFLKEEVGLTEQSYVTAIVDKLFSVVDAVHVGGAKRASELSTEVGERLLRMHMTGPEERGRAREIAENLNKSFFAHGDAVSRTRARELQLKVAEDDQDLELLIWQAFLGLESYMQLREPFNLLSHYIANGGEPSITPRAPLALPPDTPAEVAQGIWNAMANASVQNLSKQGIEVEYELVNAVVESRHRASEYRTKGVVTAVRLTGGEIQLNATDKHSGWRPVDVGPGGSQTTVENGDEVR